MKPSGAVRHLRAVSRNRVTRALIVAIGGAALVGSAAGSISTSDRALRRPDLLVSSLSAPPASGNPGDTFVEKLATKNVGTAPAGRSSTRLYLSLDRKKGPGDLRLPVAQAVPRLKPKRAARGSLQETLPPSMLAGSWFVLACADDKHRVREKSEKNNCRSTGSPVVVTKPPPPGHPPTNINLSSAAVAENKPSGTAVGTLTSVDPDVGDTFAYTLVPGTGSTDNGSFAISGATLKTNASFNFEAKQSYSIRVRTTDSTSRFFEKQLTISVTNVNEAPSNITLVPTVIAEGQPPGATVGTLTATDQDVGQTHSFSLQGSGCGGSFPDNSAFSVNGSTLTSAVMFSYATKSSYTICIRATDGGSPALSFDKQLTVTIRQNSAPTDLALSSMSVAENQPAGTTVGTFSTTDPDVGETFTYSLVGGTGSTDNGSFTIVGNALKTSAAFDYEAKNSYSIRVRSTDSGSLFTEKALTISVTNVNEPPVNTVPGTQTVNEDTDLTFSAENGNAVSIADPDAGGGTIKLSLDVAHGTLTLASTTGLTFVETTANGTASVHVTGTLANINADLAGLKYKGTANYNSTRGAEALTMITNDQENSGSGGAQSDTDTVPITVTAVNDAPTAATHSYSAQANMKITGLTDLLSGASDPDTGDGGYTASFTVGTVSVTNPAGGTISNLNTSTGSFDFDPPAGATGAVTFTYTVCDSGNPGPPACSPAATVTVNVSGPVIWFVNASAATNGTGTLNSPFNNLAAANAVDGANQGLFLYSSGTSYTGALALNSGEKLIGQGTTGTTFDSVFGITPPVGTVARPTLGSGTATMTGTLTLAGSTKLRGLALSTGASSGLVGSGGISGVDLDQVSVTTTTGTAVNLNNAAGTYVFSSVSTNGAAIGMELATLGTSSVTVNGGTIANASNTGVDVFGGSGSYTLATSITTTGSGRSVAVGNHTGGTVAFTGAVTDSGIGISLNTNTGATINFSGGIAASTAFSPGFSAAGGGTVNVTGSNNTLTATTSAALNVQNTTIGASGLTFKSISASGGANGIVLNNTGGSGGLTVTGTGSAGSGGTIANSTTDGIVLTSTATPSLSWMSVTDSAGGATDDGIQMTNVTGTVTIAHDTITNAPHNGMIVDNFNTNMTAFNMSTTTIQCQTGQTCQPSGSNGNDGLLLEMRGTSVLASGSITSSTFSGLRATGAQVLANDSARIGNASGGAIVAPAASNSFTVQSNTFTGNNTGVDMSQSQVANMAFQVLSNTIGARTGATTNEESSSAINTFTAAGADTGPVSHFHVGKIDGNSIGTQGVKDSGSGFGNGIRAVVQGQNTHGSITISNNTIREVPNAGNGIISLFGQDGAATTTSGSARFKVVNNVMPANSGTNLNLGCGGPCTDMGIFALADEDMPVCAVMTGNSIYDVTTAPGGVADIYLAERSGPPVGAQLTVEGTGGSNSAYLQANNTLAGATKFVDEGSNTAQVAPVACGTFPS